MDLRGCIHRPLRWGAEERSGWAGVGVQGGGGGVAPVALRWRNSPALPVFPPPAVRRSGGEAFSAPPNSHRYAAAAA